MEEHDLEVEHSIYEHDEEYKKLIKELIQKCFPTYTE